MIYNKRRPFPSSAVYVGRPSKFGNPFTVQQYSRGEAIRLYKQWIIRPEQANLRNAIRAELRGKDLVCWCAPEPCHAEVIEFIANTERDPQ